jgi:hypothetical protein
MDCESCGRHRPSDQVVPARSSDGSVLMLCGSCRRHMTPRPGTTAGLRALPRPLRPIASPWPLEA